MLCWQLMDFADLVCDDKYYFKGKFVSKDSLSPCFYWDSKRNKIDGVDLKHIFNLFGIKDIEDFAKLGIDVSHFLNLNKKIRTILFSYKGKMDVSQYSVIELVPHTILMSFFQEKLFCLEQSFKWLKDKTYGQELLDFFQNDFDSQILNKVSFPLTIKEGQTDVNLLFAANFRFKSVQGAFNLFNLGKEKRDSVIPQNENAFIYAVDFKAFEFRTFLKLIDFPIDFNIPNLYEHFGEMLRLETDDVKVKIIAYLYGKKDERLEALFQRDKLKNTIQDGYFKWNKYPVIVSNDGNEVHTIVQTISQYIYLEKLNKVLALFENKKSKFIYPFHDCLIFSIDKQEIDLISKVVAILEDDVYKVKQFVGKNYLNLDNI